MNGRILAMSGMSLLLLVGGAQARSSDTERNQTRALNLQQSQMGEAALPQAPPAKDAAANLSANAPPAAAPVMIADAAPLPAAAGENNAPASARTGTITPLVKMQGLPNEIASAKVIDENGKMLGAVQRIELAAANAPLKVDVVLIGSNKIVTFDAARVSYDPARNVVIAKASDGQPAPAP